MKTMISSKGQVVIPKAYRRKLGRKLGRKLAWEAGTELVVEEDGGQVLLKAEPTRMKTRNIREVAGILHHPGIKAATIEEMNAAIAKAVKEMWDS